MHGKQEWATMVCVWTFFFFSKFSLTNKSEEINAIYEQNKIQVVKKKKAKKYKIRNDIGSELDEFRQFSV